MCLPPGSLEFEYFVMLASDCFKERNLTFEVHCVPCNPIFRRVTMLLNFAIFLFLYIGKKKNFCICIYPLKTLGLQSWLQWYSVTCFFFPEPQGSHIDACGLMPPQFMKLKPWVVFHRVDVSWFFIHPAFDEHSVCLAIFYASGTSQECALAAVSCAFLPRSGVCARRWWGGSKGRSIYTFTRSSQVVLLSSSVTMSDWILWRHIASLLENVRLHLFCKCGGCEGELSCFVNYFLITSEMEHTWSGSLSFLIGESTCSYAVSSFLWDGLCFLIQSCRKIPGSELHGS